MSGADKISQKSARYMQAIELISAGLSYSQVGDKLGIDRRTLWIWRQDPLYRLVEEEYLDGAVSAAKAELRAMVLDAVKVLRESIEASPETRDEAAKWKVRQDAAREVLKLVGISSDSLADDRPLSEAELDALIVKLGLVPAQEARH